MGNLAQAVIDVLTEMADELEGEFRDKYINSDGEFLAPLYEHRYERDMEIVHRARALIQEIKNV